MRAALNIETVAYMDDGNVFQRKITIGNRLEQRGDERGSCRCMQITSLVFCLYLLRGTAAALPGISRQVVEKVGVRKRTRRGTPVNSITITSQFITVVNENILNERNKSNSMHK